MPLSSRSSRLGSLWIQLALPRRSDESSQPLGFLRRRATTRFGQREVLAPRVDITWSSYRGNQSLVSQSAQHLVQRACRGIEPSTGLLLDIFPDRVAMRGPVAEGQENME